jgi:hypothetical protein
MNGQPDVTGRVKAELGGGYRGRLRVSERTLEERPSLMWQGDSAVLGGDAPRWALRVWIDEYYGDRNFPRPLGFANLRPLEFLYGPKANRFSHIPATADAFLAPPVHMDPPEYEIYLASDFHTFYGERLPGEKVTCYCLPYDGGGGVCAHACLYMSAVMLLRRGFRALTAHEVGFQNACENTGEISANRNRVQHFTVKGLKATHMKDVLRLPESGGSAVLEVPRCRDAQERSLVVYLIHQYLRQYVPVILIVKLTQTSRQQGCADNGVE